MTARIQVPTACTLPTQRSAPQALLPLSRGQQTMHGELAPRVRHSTSESRPTGFLPVYKLEIQGAAYHTVQRLHPPPKSSEYCRLHRPSSPRTTSPSTQTISSPRTTSEQVQKGETLWGLADSSKARASELQETGLLLQVDTDTSPACIVQNQREKQISSQPFQLLPLFGPSHRAQTPDRYPTDQQTNRPYTPVLSHHPSSHMLLCQCAPRPRFIMRFYGPQGCVLHTGGRSIRPPLDFGAGPDTIV